ncbi:hypothetical protein GCM10023321_19860 [Pseudonocardia eucalypti]|uniref:HTH cro/C1-type domain-containing protein n=1 Tax=Pseudonocardia eucalypti TaxID=648755 RepID=A0ABP9PTP7_9PSEU|nr:DNA-binding XRE family transcriptional regulator [Pseudonocardia eucalypti]
MNSRRRGTEDQIHQRLAALRLERGVSRLQLAKALDLHPQTLGYLERGHYQPSLAVALKIASLFQLPVEAIFSSPVPSQPLRMSAPPGNAGEGVMPTERDRLVQRFRAAWDRRDAELAAGLRGFGGRASHRTRRWLVVGFLVCVAMVPLARLLPGIAGMMGVIGMFAGLLLVLIVANASDIVGDHLDSGLDEIQIRVQDSYDSRAYRMLTSGCAVAFLILFSVAEFAPPLDSDIVQAVCYPLFMLAMGLPTMIAGWSLPDLDQPAE